MKGNDRMKAGIWMVAVLLGLGVLAIAETAKSPAVLLQEALYQEQTEGNLDKAIELYQQVIEQAADVERVAARATYQLALCYLKKGDTQKAAEHFQTVANFYSNQSALAQKASAELKKIKPPQTQGIESQIIFYLQQQNIKAYRKAKDAGVKLNSIAWYVDDRGMKTQGGFLTFENDTDQTIESEVAVGRFEKDNITQLTNDRLQQQTFRYEDTGNEKGRYQLMWTPDHPVKPNEVVVLPYRLREEALPATARGCTLEMSNHFGAEVLENFFVILPANINIAAGLDNLTSHQRVSGFDVYEWQQQVPENTTHAKTLELEIDRAFAEAEKPTVIESFPATYANDIRPDITEISVTFDQDMHQHGWAWCRVTGPEDYPKNMGTPHYTDARTCTVPAQVQPSKSYIVVINSGQYQGFKSTDQIPAREYAIVFSTADENGNPTPINENLLKKAQEINDRNTIPEPVLDTVPDSVRASIAAQFRKTVETAQEKGLRTNSHVHIIDENMNRYFGMVQVFTNNSDRVMNTEIQLGRNDSPEMYIYDEFGVRQKIRTSKIPGRNYQYYWTPSSPIQPGENRMLIYSGSAPSMMYFNTDGQAVLNMQNHYGSPVIEDFYLVLPGGFELADQTEPFTTHETVDGFEVYCWSKEQGYDVNHHVQVTLKKTR